MAEEFDKICPIMSYQREGYPRINCIKSCGWYDERFDECCIKTMTSHLGLITEVCDGSRTLFVREC